jgi:hypothetical protein
LCSKEPTAVGDKLYFNATVKLAGEPSDQESELWHVAATQVTKIDIHPGEGWSEPTNLTAMDYTLFLFAFDGIDRKLGQVRDLTVEKIDIFAGSGSGEVQNIRKAGVILYFSAWGDFERGAEAWALHQLEPSLYIPGIARN